MSLDQFFTPTAYAKQCITTIEAMYPLASFDNIIEPSAGSGAFWHSLPPHTIGLDLEPQCEGIIKQDFFDFEFPQGKTIVIGNPPYGRRGSLAAKFFNKCADHADVIAFILPRGFVRPNLQKMLDKRFHLVFEDRCEDFELPDGTYHKVRSVFQIWEKQDELRIDIEEPTEHEDFEMTHHHISWITDEQLKETQAKYPICIGQNNMRVQQSTDVSRGSVWFIKPKNKTVEKRFYKADFTFVKEDATAAPSLSKSDIVKGYVNVQKTT